MQRKTSVDRSISEQMHAVARAAAETPEMRSLAQAEDVVAAQARTIERLWFLVEASKVLNSTTKLPDLLNAILDIAMRETEADRGTVFLVDDERNELWSIIADSIHEREIRLPMGHGIAGHVAAYGDVVNLEDAYTDERFDPQFDQAFHYRTKSVLCVPIRDRDDKIVGVLQLLNKGEPCERFNDDDISFLESISVHAAIALENARIRRQLQRTRFLEGELDVASEIQRKLLPESDPEVPGFEIAARHESTFHVGGDFFDFVAIDDDTFVFVIGDVEGKGVASAMVMANLQATFYALVRHVHSLESIMYSLNESILRNTLGAKFMTLFIGLIDLPTRGLHYLNAGHVPPFVLPADGLAPVKLDSGGMAIGMFPGIRYKRGSYSLREGDVIVACTDGITEKRNVREEEFGDERVAEIVAKLRTASARTIVDSVCDECSKFGLGGSHMDDRVMMAIRVLERPGK